jgi:hypothetical protein
MSFATHRNRRRLHTQVWTPRDDLARAPRRATIRVRDSRWQ